MRVKQIELIPVALPRRRPHGWATSITQVGHCYVIVRATTDDGRIGYGEATVLPEWGGDYGRYYGESPATVIAVTRDHLFPVVKDQSPLAVEPLLEQMHKVVRGHLYAKAALEMALLDIAGQALGQPLYNLWGGAVRTRIPLAHSLGLLDAEPALEEAVQAVAEGIRTIKIKGGLDPDRDVRLIHKLAARLGDQVALVLDGNQAYGTVVAAVRVIRAVEDCHLAYVEQPVPGLANLAAVRAQVRVPVMADESVWTHYDALEAIQAGAADLISIYVTKAGGLLGSRKVAVVAEAGGLRCNVNGSAEFGVGNAANLHVAASCAAAGEACVIPVTTLQGRAQTQVAGRFYQDDILTAPFRYENGCLVVPDGPGLGVAVDEEKLRHYTVSQPVVLA